MGRITAVQQKSYPQKPFKNQATVIHVRVALCDNTYQGIVPVPAKIGNGQDPQNNLYWGCAFGIKTYFSKSNVWTKTATLTTENPILERVVFKHKTFNAYLIADAYDGKYIQQCTEDFLAANCGQRKDSIVVNNQTIGIDGNANVLAYIGHNGLMDFTLDSDYTKHDSSERKCIILACKSKPYFSTFIRQSGSYPLLWTTQFMAPEAYTLHDALEGYLREETNNQIHERASLAYSKFQKCSKKATLKLLATGF